MTENPTPQAKRHTRGRRKIGNVGMAYLDAVERQKAEQRANAAKAMARMKAAA